MVVLALAATSGAGPGAGGSGADWVEYTVGLNGQPSQQPGDDFHGGKVVSVNHAVRFLGVRTPNPQGFEQSAGQNPNVRYVEQTPEIALFFTPNDPFFGDQWGFGPTPGIGAEAAWDVTRGSLSVRVAVLDSGIDASHPDIGNIGTSFNHADGNSDVSDCDGHGTHVAGTVGALTDNGIGVAGTAETTIMVGKVFGGSNCGGNFNFVANAITWAVDNGADVISMSLGCAVRNCGHTATSDALQYATDNNVLSVCAAGNSGPGPNSVEFPATSPNCMAISASTSSGGFASFSSRGSQVELIAPGSGIVSTYINGQYASASGTSMAAPHVSGTAALTIAALGIRGETLRAHLKATAVDLGLSADRQGAGAVSAANAVGSDPGDPGDPGDPDPPAGGELHTHDVSLTRQGPHVRSYVWSFDGAESAVGEVSVTADICRSDGTCVTRSGTTGSDGSVELRWQHAGSGTYTTCVTGMSRDGYTWDEAAGHASDGNCHTASV